MECGLGFDGFVGVGGDREERGRLQHVHVGLASRVVKQGGQPSRVVQGVESGGFGMEPGEREQGSGPKAP